MTDHGPGPYVLDVEQATLDNDSFRTVLLGGEHLQLTAMAIPVGEDIGLEVHPDNDQFLRVEAGRAHVRMGPSATEVTFEREVGDDDVIMVPAGMWHNVVNTGDVALKVYSLYGPAHHPHGTVHPTKADAEADEHDH